MIKNVQTKIIIVFFVTGIIIILGLGFFFDNLTWQANMQYVNELGNNQEAMQIFENLESQTKILILITILVFSCIMLLMGIFVIQVVIRPINNLIKNTEKIANGDNFDLITVKNSKKRKFKKGKNKKNTEIDALTNVIELMTEELRQNLTSVNKQKRELEIIFERMNDGIIAFNINGKVTHINPAAKKLLELDDNDDSFEKVFDKLNVDVTLEAVMYLESITASEQRIKVGEKTVNIFFAPYKDENQLFSGVISVIQDITEHVRLDDMRKEFVADVSHELKTPITSILGYADTLQDGEYDAETQKKFLSVISSEGNRMANLVSDLLTLSRYDINRGKNEPVEFDLGELAKQCKEKLEMEREKKNQNIECYVTAEVPLVKADKQGIERVILNVLSNAIKYTQENGSIKIYVGFVYNDAYIKVIDNGIGIPEEDLEKVFERFYRVDKARTREMGGTGLGLSIAKEVMEQNGGSINLKSELGNGTEVVIRVPISKKETKAEKIENEDKELTNESKNKKNKEYDNTKTKD